MRTPYLQTAVLELRPTVDLAAPGAAITVELCGSVEHPPPCPLAAHHTRASLVRGQVHLRVLFATEPRDEQQVRARIVEALARPADPGAWTLVSTAPGELTPGELAHGKRIAGPSGGDVR